MPQPHEFGPEPFFITQLLIDYREAKTSYQLLHRQGRRNQITCTAFTSSTYAGTNILNNDRFFTRKHPLTLNLILIPKSWKYLSPSKPKAHKQLATAAKLKAVSKNLHMLRDTFESLIGIRRSVARAPTHRILQSCKCCKRSVRSKRSVHQRVKSSTHKWTLRSCASTIQASGWNKHSSVIK